MYQDRIEAGKKLSKLLTQYQSQENTIILALPRGGIPVAHEIAKVLHLPLDILIVRKLGVPSWPELAMGAIASGGGIYLNDEIIRNMHISQSSIDLVLKKEKYEMERRELLYREGKAFPSLKDKTIILIDDGIATGATMLAAIKALQNTQPVSIIIAVPVAPPETCRELAVMVDELICPLQPPAFNAVGFWYQNFEQTTDSEVIALLHNQ